MPRRAPSPGPTSRADLSLKGRGVAPAYPRQQVARPRSTEEGAEGDCSGAPSALSEVEAAARPICSSRRSSFASRLSPVAPGELTILPVAKAPRHRTRGVYPQSVRSPAACRSGPVWPPVHSRGPIRQAQARRLCHTRARDHAIPAKIGRTSVAFTPDLILFLSVSTVCSVVNLPPPGGRSGR